MTFFEPEYPCEGYFQGMCCPPSQSSGYSPAAVEDAKTGLSQKVFVLTKLQEVVEILERDGDLKAMFKEKINRAKTDKKQFF